MSVYARRGVGWRSVQLAISSVWWLVTFGGRLGSDSVITLCYHGVLDEDGSSFEKQMLRIRERSIASTETAVTGRTFRKPRVCITFDDAFRNLGRNVIPILREHGIAAVIFAVSENAGCPPAWEIDPEHPEAGESTMSALELREAADDRIEIGSHTATHAKLTDLPDQELQREVVQSKASLESELGSSVRFLAFPHGAAGTREIEAAKEAGYVAVFTLDPEDRGDFVRGRYLMSPDVWPAEFALTADGAYSWIVLVRRLRDIVRRSARKV
jgi:peptidoglycan/xylan/chitin deacetylase (PgdA/CDA1 family)